jgi:hypothetical protein
LYVTCSDVTGLQIYNFDRKTGLLSNHQTLDFMPDSTSRFCFLEFSPNGRFIYLAEPTKLHQIDLWAESLEEGIMLIDTFDGTKDPFATIFNVMQMGPDCKIYMGCGNGIKYLHVINNPNEKGKACQFVQRGLSLPYYNDRFSLPNFPHFRIDEGDICDPTITNIFGDAVHYRRDLKVYPSPSFGRYTIEMPEGFRRGRLSVLSIDGQMVYHQDVSSGTFRVDIDITAFPSGYYHIELYSENTSDRIFWSRQVVKE